MSFSPLPEPLVGLGLSRDALTETLTLRRAIPPVVPIAHLHALLPSSPTATERAIAALVAGGRRVSILQPGARARFEGVIRTEDFVASVTRCSALSKNVKEAFLGVLAAHPATATIAAETLPRDAVMELLAAGFLTISNVAQLHDPSGSSFGDGASVDIAALTPTVGALIIPQQDHTHLSSLSSLASVSSASSRTPPQLSTAGASVEYTVTPPNLGLLTHLQVASRARMLEILRRCPQREATLAFLREKWDGGVSKQKQARVGRRDPAARKWEGRTRKWREYKGLTADWVIDGMVGGGVLETFHAVGVGMGVKIAD
ncbi:hypothetical protein DRE_04556 [Drechslerella stenobrocha 248]|uniref:Serine-threonine protein kinase 19 n=1 Tax=Drechslerella stenobrocha 248 TaxID=1043628 RepID=W7I1R1_9PEZI|nr:hypothetical protein DRE_04556 [Drechslerella stenobrocha 248]